MAYNRLLSRNLDSRVKLSDFARNKGRNNERVRLSKPYHQSVKAGTDTNQHGAIQDAMGHATLTPPTTQTNITSEYTGQAGTKIEYNKREIKFDTSQYRGLPGSNDETKDISPLYNKGKLECYMLDYL